MLDDLISICVRLRGSKEADCLSFTDRCGLCTQSEVGFRGSV